MNLTRLECERPGCFKVLEGTSPGGLQALAESLGWDLLHDARYEHHLHNLVAVYCDEHNIVEEPDRWRVGCDTCGWDTDTQYEIDPDWGIPYDKESAEQYARGHDCRDWREHDHPSTFIDSPDDLRKAKEREVEYLRGKEKKEAEAQARSERAAIQIQQTQAQAARYRLLVEMWPVGLCAAEILFAIIFWLGYVTR